MESILSKLHLKYAQKTWNETFQLVHRCMDKTRDDSKTNKLLTRSLERLSEALNVTSLHTMKSRLEIIAKQQGMGFHVTEHMCYLTADLFYLEVVLLPCGGAAEVKVATHGDPPMASEVFLQQLRSKDFAVFSKKLASMWSQYNIPGNNELKLKLFMSLQCIGKDLLKMSLSQREPQHSDPRVDMICNGRVGCLIADREDCPLTIQFYVNPTNEIKTSASHVEPVVQAAQVTVTLSDIARKLQMASVIPQPLQIDRYGHPMFMPLGEVLFETLPACFLLKLQPPVPILSSFVNMLSQITGVTIPDVDLQWAPLPMILLQSLPHCDNLGEDKDKTKSVGPPPGQKSPRCVFSRPAWEVPAQIGTMMDAVPFTHPAHIPALLELLRHQCAYNALLRSCIDSPGSVYDLHFEVLSESETSFTVAFIPPDTDDLAVLLVNVAGPHHITCSVYGAAFKDLGLDDHVSTIMKRYMSVPLALKALCGKLERITAAAPSSDRPAATEAGNDPSVTDTNNTVTSSVSSQSSAGPAEEGFTVSACFAVSVATPELYSDISSSSPVDPYQVTNVGLFPLWTNDTLRRS
ncbi:mediator of RNA polymerase II transcription subunit 1-like [Genypterus blacodes]|uniref:mediator of RNA polymerase II transcription subunit 1-like n=1 Tax=Genypterus blacodes TaxID=154954 RepID=UPI003F766DD5